VRQESLRGYILDELLARLIRGSGYQLLVSPDQDPQDLVRKGEGLVVRGRGGVHQVDVLGQLAWIPAFTYPIRLFVEAKAWDQRVGIPVVRAAVGVLADLNQNYRPAEAGGPPLPRYSYSHALFSASGFTKPASNLAIAHQISLIDLSTAAFAGLRALLDELASLIFRDVAPAVSPDRQEPHERTAGPRKSTRVAIPTLRNHFAGFLGRIPWATTRH
jgi:hypothetical protein